MLLHRLFLSAILFLIGLSPLHSRPRATLVFLSDFGQQTGRSRP